MEKTVQRSSAEYIKEPDHSFFYSNSLEVQTSYIDFMLKFKQNSPVGYLDNKNIILNPSLAKQLNKALTEAIHEYENMHGQIKDLDDLMNETEEYFNDSEQY